MNIFKRFKNWRTTRRLNRLEADIIMLRNKINFDPRYAFKIDDLDNSQAYTRKMEEYRVWYIGNGRALRQLYREQIKSESLNYFWYKAPINYRMLHCGIPGLISSKMATIIFGGGYKAEITVFDESGEPNEQASKEAQEFVDNLILITDLNERLKTIAENESWGGEAFLKLSHKISLSNYSIVETADIRKAEAVYDRGILTGVIFKYWYDHNRKHYRLDEIYSTNEDGDANIKYELYQMQADGTETRIALESISEGLALKYDENGIQKLNDRDEFVYTGLKGMLAFAKVNRTPSHEFMDSYHGASDYEGAIDSFDALDEAYSELISEIRTNKTIRYVPDSMIPKRAVSVTVDGVVGTEYVSMLPDEFVTNYVKVESDPDQNAKNQIDIQQIQDKTEANLAKFRTCLTTAINKAGLSPMALGITGLESVASGADSQRERNKVTLETRAYKIGLYDPFIKDVLYQMITLNSWIQKNTTANQDAFVKQDLNFDNTNISITFADYIVEEQAKKLVAWGTAKAQRVASTKEAIKNIHPDWTSDKVDEEVNLIRFEEGMSLDNPNNLPELTGVIEEGEDDKDDGDADGELN